MNNAQVPSTSPSDSAFTSVFLSTIPAEYHAALTAPQPAEDLSADAFAPAYRGLNSSHTDAAAEFIPSMSPDELDMVRLCIAASRLGWANALVADGRMHVILSACIDRHHARITKAYCGKEFLSRKAARSFARMRRMEFRQPALYERILSGSFSLLRLSIPRTQSGPLTPSEALANQRTLADLVLRWLRIVNTDRQGGFYRLMNLNPSSTDTSCAIIYVGPKSSIIPFSFRTTWASILPGAQLSLLQHCSPSACDKLKLDTLSLALSGLERIAELPAAERFQWATTFEGVALTTPYGILRGLDDSSSPRRLAGPCECPTCHKPEIVGHTFKTLSEIRSTYKLISFGHTGITPKHMHENSDLTVIEGFAYDSGPPN